MITLVYSAPPVKSGLYASNGDVYLFVCSFICSYVISAAEMCCGGDGNEADATKGVEDFSSVKNSPVTCGRSEKVSHMFAPLKNFPHVIYAGSGGLNASRFLISFLRNLSRLFHNKSSFDFSTVEDLGT